jgi:hypothetical protein
VVARGPVAEALGELVQTGGRLCFAKAANRVCGPDQPVHPRPHETRRELHRPLVEHRAPGPIAELVDEEGDPVAHAPDVTERLAPVLPRDSQT